MESTTVASLFSLIQEQGRWTSNICLPVYESLESDEVTNVDLCSTLNAPGEERISRMTAPRSAVPGDDFRFRVRLLYSALTTL